MTVQLSYSENPDVAVEGMIADDGPVDIVSGLSNTRKLVSVAVTADNTQAFTVTINGTDFVFTSDGSGSTAEITAGLVALINAGSEPVEASGTDTPLILESTIDGPAGDFDLELDAGGSGDLVATVLVEQGQEIPFGKFVCLNEREGDADGQEADFFVRLPRVSADITGEGRLGLVIEDRAREENAGTVPGQCMVPVMMSGKAWVKVEEDVSAGTQVYVRYAAGGNGPGSAGDTSGSSARAAYPRARYLKGASANGLALVKLAD
jgi:hypothetical protein